jgi:hypothetical protein
MAVSAPTYHEGYYYVGLRNANLARPLFYAIVQLSEGTKTQESKYIKTSRRILRWHEKKLKN